MAWQRLRWSQWIGGGLSIVSLGLFVTLAYVAGAAEPPSRSQQVLLGLLATAAQLGATLLIARNGKPHRSHAHASVRNLLQLFIHLEGWKVSTEKLLRRRRSLTDEELRHHLGGVSVALDEAAARTADAVSHWRQFQPDATAAAESEIREEGSNAG